MASESNRVSDLFKPRPFIPYEVPIRDGESARLVLPADLTEAEAEHLCGVIRALAFKEPPGEQTTTGEDAGDD